MHNWLAVSSANPVPHKTTSSPRPYCMRWLSRSHRSDPGCWRPAKSCHPIGKPLPNSGVPLWFRWICILLLLMVIPATVAADSRETLREEVRQWVASTVGVPPAAVYVAHLDRRTAVEPCPSGRRFDFPFAARTLVRSHCPDSEWRLFVRVEIRATTSVITATRDLPAAHRLEPDDIEWSAVTDAPDQSATSLEEVLGRTLRRAVFAGEPLVLNMLEDTVALMRLIAPVRRGENLDGQYEILFRSAREVPHGAITEWSRDRPGVAAGNLQRGRILLESDIIDPRQVVVSSRTLPSGTRLSSDAIQIEERHRGDIPRDALSLLEGLGDMEVSRMLRAGEIIRTSDIRPARLIQRGQLVNVTFRRGTLEVTSQARASSDGRIGEVITLVNPDTGRELRAQVTGPGQTLLLNSGQ